MREDGYWSWKIRDVIIAPQAGQFEVSLNGRKLGTYATAESALDEVLRGSPNPDPDSSLRTTDLAPSDKLIDWPFVSKAAG